MSAEREFALEVVKVLRAAGHEALWAGGCVRDMLLGLDPHDYDVATSATPEVVLGLFPFTVQVGAAFGVVDVLGPRREGGRITVEVATFRTEGPYSDGRHPDTVQFSSAEEDARRRDFTINGMFFDPIQERVIDHVGGQADLQGGILRAIGEARARFHEDKLRMLRAVRIAARFFLTIEPETFAAIRDMAAQIAVVSAERIAEELRKMLTHPGRVRAMDLLWETGLLNAILPELAPMKGLPQGSPSTPSGDLWDHVMKVLGYLPDPSFPLALAGLLHDVGKPRTVGRTPDRYTFHSHEHVGRRIASDICSRLRLSNAERELVEWLVEKHQYLSDARTMRTSKLKTILAHPHIRDLLALHRADALASERTTDHVDYCESLLAEWSEADLNPPALLTGHDLIRRGLRPGPAFREILDRVREAQLEGEVCTQAEAMEVVAAYLQDAGKE